MRTNLGACRTYERGVRQKQICTSVDSEGLKHCPSPWPARGSNPGSSDLNSDALTTEPRPPSNDDDDDEDDDDDNDDDDNDDDDDDDDALRPVNREGSFISGRNKLCCYNRSNSDSLLMVHLAVMNGEVWGEKNLK